tara:strand:- start:385 stop:1752 length:1368 start_codon:yes stop_codon:yes gene_type:complete
MSLTIDSSNDSDLKDTIFNLDEESVNSATVNPTDDASVILRTLVLKMFQKKIKDTRRFDKKSVKKNFRILMSLNEKDFDSKEEYETYEKYMKILVEKALKLPVIETINAMENNFSAKKGAAVFELFGPDKENSIVENLDKKNVNFEQLLLPAYLGQTYTGKGGKPSKLMNTIDKNESLFDKDKMSKFLETPVEKTNASKYTWDVKAYLTNLLAGEGWFDIKPFSGQKLIESFDDSHLRFMDNKQNISSAINTSVGDNLLFDAVKSNEAEGFTLQPKTKAEGSELDIIAGYEIYRSGKLIKEYAFTDEGRGDALEFIRGELKLEADVLDDVAKYLLENSNFMKARRVKDRDKETRDPMNEPSISEITRNYLDLDVGKVSFEVSINPAVLKLVDGQEKTKKEALPILKYGLVINKEGELRLAEEGAFVVADKDKVRGISDILKGVKTFMAKASRFRS